MDSGAAKISDYQAFLKAKAKPKPDRWPRPRILKEAREMVTATLSRDWDDEEVGRYLKSLQILKRVDELDEAEVRTVIADLEESRMVLFE
jgi:hypothetical protein